MQFGRAERGGAERDDDGVLAGWVAALRDPRLLGHDVLAGVTVGLISIPQAIAFSLVAGVPPRIALATMIVPGLAASVLRRSPHLAPGATNTGALLAGAALAASPLAASLGMLPVLSALCVLVGAIKLSIGAARLGRLARYVSPAVVLGFTSGVAVLLVLGQLRAAVGLRGSALSASVLLHGVDPLACALSLGTVALIALLAWLRPALPGPLLALAAVAVGTHWLGLDEGSRAELLGEIPRGVPEPAWPMLRPSVLLALAPAALSIALVGMTEVVSIGKSIALRTGQPFAADRELAAQGVANLVSACFPCLPSSVSWTRSAASLEAGARTPAAVALASLSVLLASAVLAPLARHVPLASVAGVVVWIAARMIKLEDLRRVLRADRADFAVLIATALLTLFVDLPIAVFTGVALSLGLVVRRASLLRMSELHAEPGGHFQERPLGPETGKDAVTLLQVEGDLFFAVADELERRLDEVADHGARGLVLRLKRTLAIDAAAAAALARFARRFAARGGKLVLCGLRPELTARIERTELEAALGPDAFFYTGGRPFESVERALQVFGALGDPRS